MGDLINIMNRRDKSRSRSKAQWLNKMCCVSHHLDHPGHKRNIAKFDYWDLGY